MAKLGDPSTRPEEEECFIPTPHAMKVELKDWESTAVITWAAKVPASITPRDVEAIFKEEFHLREGDVFVSRHHLEAFLIKFEHQRHCVEALRKGFVKRRGVELHYIKWCSLKSALGVAMMFRVRLYLDGIPRHAWEADIVERTMAKTCVLESIETSLIHPLDTRWISMWAWTGNPSSIPKRVWLIFTNSTRGKKPDLVSDSDKPPERWQHGVKYCVYVHLKEIHDYTSATVTLDENVAVTPAKRRLPLWHLGVADGEPAPERVFPEFPHHPPPPQGLFRPGAGRDEGGKMEEDRGSRNRGDRRDVDRRDVDRRGRDDDTRDRFGRERDGRDKGSRRHYNDDHPDFDRGLGWRRRDDDDDEHDDRAGRGRDSGRGRDAAKRTGLNGQRESDHSPRRRDWGEGGSRTGRRHGAYNDNRREDPAAPARVCILSGRSHHHRHR